MMHGVRANRMSMVERARILHASGFSVLLFDFQAHGESPGKRITFGYLEALDAEAAVAFVRQRLPGERIGAVGTSLGGAAALLRSCAAACGCTRTRVSLPGYPVSDGKSHPCGSRRADRTACRGTAHAPIRVGDVASPRSGSSKATANRPYRRRCRSGIDCIGHARQSHAP